MTGTTRATTSKLCHDQRQRRRHTLNTSRLLSHVSHKIRLVVLTAVLFLFCLTRVQSVRADDSNQAPGGLDMSALASIASNLGSNPQIMSMVSNLLKPPSAGATSASLSSSTGGQPAVDSFGVDQDSTSTTTVLQDGGAGIVEPQLRRGMRQPPLDPVGGAIRIQAKQEPGNGVITATAASSPVASVPAQPAPVNHIGGGLGGLLAMLPGLNLGGLAGILSPPREQASALATSVVTSKEHMERVAPSTASLGAASQAAALQQMQTHGAPIKQPAPLPNPAASPAQSVINQVLTAYAGGLIPNELIQLGLSGRVPPHVIELALSGQVPPQIIHMVITGQVPMSTINAFLGTVPGAGSAGEPVGLRAATSAGTKPVAGGPVAAAAGRPSGQSFGITRAIFESLFGRTSNGGVPGIKLPSLLGPVQVQMPALTNARRFGQMVGGTITNVASMIPF